MKELVGIAGQLDELAEKLAALKDYHAGNADAEARLDAAHQASRKAARLVRRQIRTMRISARA
jgi:hypothetical protein